MKNIYSFIVIYNNIQNTILDLFYSLIINIYSSVKIIAHLSSDNHSYQK